MEEREVTPVKVLPLPERFVESVPDVVERAVVKRLYNMYIWASQNILTTPITNKI